jgi:hypothetical protein
MIYSRQRNYSAIAYYNTCFLDYTTALIKTPPDAGYRIAVKQKGKQK